MLKWQKNFLTGETVKKPEKIKKKLDAGKFVYDIYLLTLSDNPDNLMDIIPAAMLFAEKFLWNLSEDHRHGKRKGRGSGNGKGA